MTITKYLVEVCREFYNPENKGTDTEVIEEWLTFDELIGVICGITEESVKNVEIKKHEVTIVIDQEDYEALENDNAELKDKLDNISSYLDDAISYLHDVEYEIDKATDECEF